MECKGHSRPGDTSPDARSS